MQTKFRFRNLKGSIKYPFVAYGEVVPEGFQLNRLSLFRKL